jgi:hypothetical protein
LLLCAPVLAIGGIKAIIGECASAASLVGATRGSEDGEDGASAVLVLIQGKDPVLPGRWSPSDVLESGLQQALRFVSTSYFGRKQGGPVVQGERRALAGRERAPLRSRDRKPVALPRIIPFPFILLFHALTCVQAGHSTLLK